MPAGSSWYGPAPKVRCANWPGSVSPAGETTEPERIAWLNSCRITGFGVLLVTTTVPASGAVMLAMVAAQVFAFGLTVRMYSSDRTTAGASSGVPSAKVTPGRSLSWKTLFCRST